MDYKQKYEEALNRAKNLTIPDNLEVAEYIFPELKEKFESEKIRKKVIEVLKLNIKGAEDQMQASRGIDRTFEVYACNKVISWLEKEKTSEEALEYLKKNHSIDEVNDFQTAMNIAVAKAFDAGRNSKSFINKEDEEMINLLIAIFEINYSNDIYKFNPIDATDMKGIHSFEIIDWLKSFKDKVHQCKIKIEK